MSTPELHIVLLQGRKSYNLVIPGFEHTTFGSGARFEYFISIFTFHMLKEKVHTCIDFWALWIVKWYRTSLELVECSRHAKFESDGSDLNKKIYLINLIILLCILYIRFVARYVINKLTFNWKKVFVFDTASSRRSKIRVIQHQQSKEVTKTEHFRQFTKWEISHVKRGWIISRISH